MTEIEKEEQSELTNGQVEELKRDSFEMGVLCSMRYLFIAIFIIYIIWLICNKIHIEITYVR